MYIDRVTKMKTIVDDEHRSTSVSRQNFHSMLIRGQRLEKKRIHLLPSKSQLSRSVQCAKVLVSKLAQAKYVTLASDPNENTEMKMKVVRAPQNTQTLAASRCCFAAEDGNEMYNTLQRTCTAIVLLIKLGCVWRPSQCCFSRGHCLSSLLISWKEMILR